MRKLLLIAFLLSSTAVLAQTNNENPKDLWTHSIDVTLGDNWRQKTISVLGKGEPNVVDFFRAFAKAYPCEYHNLLVMALDGDNDVLFCHTRPYIDINKDSCWMNNESFSMRVFYNDNKPVALGVCCHKAITTELQEAYYFRYNSATRKLIPIAQGSDFTGGILKRVTSFAHYKKNNRASMVHGWGRCGVENWLEWDNGKFVLKDYKWEVFDLQSTANITSSVFWEFLSRCDMELREPYESKADTNIVGGSFNSLPICVAIHDQRSKGNFEAAAAMEGFYYFYARGWERADGTMLVAVYTECAPEFDYNFKQKTEDDHYVKTPHKLTAGDEVSLCFYYCEYGHATYLDPTTPMFANIVGKGLPNLEHNEWRCVISPDNEDLTFVSETNGKTKVFKWKDNMLKEQ